MRGSVIGGRNGGDYNAGDILPIGRQGLTKKTAVNGKYVAYHVNSLVCDVNYLYAYVNISSETASYRIWKLDKDTLTQIGTTTLSSGYNSGRVREFGEYLYTQQTANTFTIYKKSDMTLYKSFTTPKNMVQGGFEIDPTNGDIYIVGWDGTSGSVYIYDKEGNAKRLTDTINSVFAGPYDIHLNDVYYGVPCSSGFVTMKKDGSGSGVSVSGSSYSSTLDIYMNKEGTDSHIVVRYDKIVNNQRHTNPTISNEFNYNFGSTNGSIRASASIPDSEAILVSVYINGREVLSVFDPYANGCIYFSDLTSPSIGALHLDNHTGRLYYVYNTQNVAAMLLQQVIK